jgi:hypothetical protein
MLGTFALTMVAWAVALFWLKPWRDFWKGLFDWKRQGKYVLALVVIVFLPNIIAMMIMTYSCT